MRKSSICGKLGILFVAILVFTMVGPPSATAETVTIRMGNWVPMHHLIVQGILIPWANAIEKESGGTIKFDIMKSALGRPNTYFDLLIDGTLDVAWGVSGHNPGRFTLSEIMDYPFMGGDAWSTSAAAWLTYQKYGAKYGEYKGAKVLGFWCYGDPYINMKGSPILNVSDLKGKKIRVGCWIQGEIVKAMGGTPVMLPPTETQQAMARGVADGIVFPLESVEFFKITPVIENATVIPGRLYNDTFWLAFNEKKWNSLTDDQRAAIEKHSGMAIAMLAGWAWTNGDNWGRAAMDKAGVKFHTMSQEQAEKTKNILKPLNDSWIAEAKKRGLNGEEIMDYARTMAHEYRAIRPVNIP